MLTIIRIIPTALFVLLLPIVSQAQIAFSVPNFLNFNSIEDLLIGILNVFIVIAVPIIVLFIIYAGFLYVTASGNAQQLQQATRALTYAIIGAVLVLGATVIAEIIANVVGEFTA